jgi:hypothetical protein
VQSGGSIFNMIGSSSMRIPVPLIVFVFGLLLTGLGLLAYFVFATPEDHSWTALIPAFWGVPIILCAIASLMSKKIRKHAMHLVAILSLLGVLAPLGRLIPMSIENGFTFDSKSFTQIAMCVLCAFLLLVVVKSFIAARRVRKALA